MIWQFVCHETTHAQLSRKQRWRTELHFRLKPSGSSEFFPFALAFQTKIHVQSLFYIVIKILTLLYLVQSKILVQFVAICCVCECPKSLHQQLSSFQKSINMFRIPSSLRYIRGNSKHIYSSKGKVLIVCVHAITLFTRMLSSAVRSWSCLHVCSSARKLVV